MKLRWFKHSTDCTDIYNINGCPRYSRILNKGVLQYLDEDTDKWINVLAIPLYDKEHMYEIKYGINSGCNYGGINVVEEIYAHSTKEAERIAFNKAYEIYEERCTLLGFDREAFIKQNPNVTTCIVDTAALEYRKSWMHYKARKL